MRALPDSVPILGVPFAVRVVSRRTIRKHSPTGAPDHGVCDAEQRIVYINRDDPPEVQWSSLLHEKIHAALKQAWLSEPVGLDLRDYEEVLVLLLERGLFPALKECGYGDE